MTKNEKKKGEILLVNQSSFGRFSEHRPSHRLLLLLQIRLRNEVTGEAELLAKVPLNCEKRKNYKFDITAISCDGIESQK